MGPPLPVLVTIPALLGSPDLHRTWRTSLSNFYCINGCLFCWLEKNSLKFALLRGARNLMCYRNVYRTFLYLLQWIVCFQGLYLSYFLPNFDPEVSAGKMYIYIPHYRSPVAPCVETGLRSPGRCGLVPFVCCAVFLYWQILPSLRLPLSGPDYLFGRLLGLVLFISVTWQICDLVNFSRQFSMLHSPGVKHYARTCCRINFLSKILMSFRFFPNHLA